MTDALQRCKVSLTPTRVAYGSSERKEFWVAEIELDSRGSVRRDFLKPMKDHGTGSLIFFPTEGGVYEICQGSDRRRRYMTVENGERRNLSFEQAVECLAKT